MSAVAKRTRRARARAEEAARPGSTGEKYREMSVAEFFAKNKELAGFANPTRALYQTIRELVENSLDATDAKGILPWIYISIRQIEGSEGRGGRPRYTVTVEDNGIGVPVTSMAMAFGKVLFSSKYVIRQTRGMYGLGVKAAILYGQMTAGTPVEVYSATKGSQYVYMMKLVIDVQRNEPRILERGEWNKRGSWHGTRVTLSLEGDWSRAKSKILEYIKRTAVIAPYAEIILETPDGEIYYFPRSTRKLPKPPKESKPHPHGVDIEQLKSMLRSTRASTLREFLVKEFQSIGDKTAQDFLEKYGLDPDLKPMELLKKGRDKLLRRLADALMEYPFRAPKSDYLSPIGSDIIEIGLRRMFNPEWVGAVSRSPKAYRGHPFIVEVGIAYGGGIEARSEPLLLRYANKIPLLYEEREDVSYKVVSSINWRQYNVDFPAPLVVLVHIASTKVPYKGVGKESVSDVPEIEAEIRNAVQEVARRLRLYLSRKAREEEAIRRSVTLAKYIPEVAVSLAYFLRPPSKWQPPKPEEVKKIQEALIKIVARHIELPPVDGKTEDPEAIVRRIVESVELE
ncbi:DNA topoisomerase VI subunit B [Aeropyrum pernix]|uniref:DNA topoisomerase VI subunit B n=1 Tax=Aeropyrum pernix TaxID=56636 RepID=UPI001037DE8E